MNRRCPSANITSKAREDFPEPDGPVTTTNWLDGILITYIFEVIFMGTNDFEVFLVLNVEIPFYPVLIGYEGTLRCQVRDVIIWMSEY